MPNGFDFPTDFLILYSTIMVICKHKKLVVYQSG